MNNQCNHKWRQIFIDTSDGGLFWECIKCLLRMRSGDTSTPPTGSINFLSTNH